MSNVKEMLGETLPALRFLAKLPLSSVGLKFCFLGFVLFWRWSS